VGHGTPVRRRGLGGPGQDGVQGGTVLADGGGVEAVAQAGAAGGVEVGWAGEVAEQVPGTQAIPESTEAGGEAGEGGVEVLADLGAQGGRLADEIAAMPDQEAQGGPVLVELLFDEGEAVEGRAVDGGAVGVVGFGAGVRGLAEAAGGEGVDDARLEAGGGEGAAWRGGWW